MGLAEWLHQRVVPHCDYHQHRYARTVSALLMPGTRWLDVGAGSRIHGGWLPPEQEELRQRATTLIGFDVQAGHLRQHPFLDGRAVGFAEHLPFRSGSIDLVTANMVLEHLVDPLAVFREIARVLRPGGAFVFVTPNRAHPVIRLLALLLGPRGRRLLARVVEHRRQAERIFLTHYRANTCDDLARLAEAAPLAVDRLAPFSSLPMFGGIAPLLLLEVLWIRVFARPGGAFESGGSNLLGVLRRPAGGLQ
jgi:SAM-dependent methyltransferase